MIKRLVVICCILLLPTIAAAEGTTNYGDFWMGGQLGAVFTPNTNVTISPPLFPSFDVSMKTNPAFSAGAIIGYNFCMPYREPWEDISAWLWTSNGTSSTTPVKTSLGATSRLRGTSLLSPSWAGYSTPSWVVKGSPGAGSCRS